MPISVSLLSHIQPVNAIVATIEFFELPLMKVAIRLLQVLLITFLLKKVKKKIFFEMLNIDNLKNEIRAALLDPRLVSI